LIDYIQNACNAIIKKMMIKIIFIFGKNAFFRQPVNLLPAFRRKIQSKNGDIPV